MKIALAAATALAAAAAFLSVQGKPPATPLDPRHAELDFWLGEWDVFDASGRKIGENAIRKELKGRLVMEEWRDVLGGEGRGMHFYDSAAKRWKLVWVDDSGSIKEKTGGKTEEHDMLVEGEVVRRDGTRALDRTTLDRLPDGKVRQRIGWSADGGKSWTTPFDATYVRRK